jgi:segregation and condensation protein A
MSATDLPELLVYQLRLPSFEGPFDVLLRLIERHQLPITDVSLVAVTDQFLAHVDALGGAPPETIAEFTNVGARLVVLKSRSLLPRPPAAEEEAASSELARQLVEYQVVKRAAEQLATRDQRGDGAFARASGAVAMPQQPASPKLAAHESAWLVRALKRRLAAIPSPKDVIAVRPLISLAAMIERVLGALTGRGDVRFSALAGECRDGHELRTAFLAVLILIRRRLVDAEQDAPFAEIVLRRKTSAWRAASDLAAHPAGDD